jgi:hypothetical protein
MTASRWTIEWHVANILGSLGLETTAQLTVWAVENG